MMRPLVRMNLYEMIPIKMLSLQNSTVAEHIFKHHRSVGLSRRVVDLCSLDTALSKRQSQFSSFANLRKFPPRFAKLKRNSLIQAAAASQRIDSPISTNLLMRISFIKRDQRLIQVLIVKLQELVSSVVCCPTYFLYIFLKHSLLL